MDKPLTKSLAQFQAGSIASIISRAARHVFVQHSTTALIYLVATMESFCTLRTISAR